MSERSVFLALAFVALVGLVLFKFRDDIFRGNPASAVSDAVSNLTYNQPAYWTAPLNANVLPTTTANISGTPVGRQSSLMSEMNSYCGCGA